jgi:hypothetical protein
VPVSKPASKGKSALQPAASVPLAASTSEEGADSAAGVVDFVRAGEKVFKKFKLLSQTGFSIKFKTAFFDKNRKLWFGTVTSLRDPQRYYNKALSEFVKIIATTSKPGVLYNTDSVIDAEEFEKLYEKLKEIDKIRSKIFDDVKKTEIAVKTYTLTSLMKVLLNMKISVFTIV